jgi:hypothetical protein
LVGVLCFLSIEGELAVADGDDFLHGDRAIEFFGGLEV